MKFYTNRDNKLDKYTGFNSGKTPIRYLWNPELKLAVVETGRLVGHYTTSYRSQTIIGEALAVARRNTRLNSTFKL